MFAGALPITDKGTLDILTNKLALMINDHSHNLQAAYQGDCRCTIRKGFPKNTSHECTLVNDPASKDPCVVTWWSPIKPSDKCMAVAVMNIGIAPAAGVKVNLIQIGLPASPEYTVTHIYEGSSEVVKYSDESFQLSVPAQGGSLLLVTPEGVAAAECTNSGLL
jgi:hypothetical protein